jgi:lysozyme
MQISDNGLDTIKKFEGFRLQAYQDSVGVWTLGYGSTFFPNGTKVKEGDTVSYETAHRMLENVANMFSKEIAKLITSEINQNQFDALVSFSYNVGINNFKKSHLLELVNKDPNDPAIKQEFLKWNKAGGKVLKGLMLRRQAESELFFKQN